MLTRRSVQIFHGHVFMCISEWRDKLKKIGLSKNWIMPTGDRIVREAYNTTSIFRFDIDAQTAIYLKRYEYKKPKLKHWLQPTKAIVEAVGLHELGKLGIPTVKVVAYGEHRWFGFIRSTFIVTQAISDQLAMNHYLARVWYQLPRQEKKQALDKLQPVVIGQLQKIHRTGFFHWDLKLRNLLITIPVSDKPTITWIDCPRSRSKSPDNFSGTVKDLSDMARVGIRVLTPGQQFRFLLDYCNGNKTRTRRLYLAVANRLKKYPPKPYQQLLAKDESATP